MTLTFGQRIRKLRETAKKSLKDLADAVGVSVVYISDIERGHRNPPHGDKLYKMADFFHLERKEVEEWALKERKRVELDLKDGNGPVSDAALALARRWDTLTEDEATEIIKILTKETKDAPQ